MLESPQLARRPAPVTLLPRKAFDRVMRTLAEHCFIWSERRTFFLRGGLGDSETSWIELNLVMRCWTAAAVVWPSSLIESSFALVVELRRRIDLRRRHEMALSCLVSDFSASSGTVTKSVSELQRFKRRVVGLFGTLPKRSSFYFLFGLIVIAQKRHKSITTVARAK